MRTRIASDRLGDIAGNIISARGIADRRVGLTRTRESWASTHSAQAVPRLRMVLLHSTRFSKFPEPSKLGRT